MALQGSLSNFAGGILILLFRPFEVGDYISSANGSGGTVERIDLLYTTLIDDEGLRVFSPNGTLANSVIKNYTKISSRRIYFSFLISYDSNIKEARKIILDVCQADNRILSKPAATVYVGDLNDNGVSLTVLAWTKKEDFGVVKNEIAEKIQTLIDGRNIVFPQTSIKILPNEEQA
jgi:small conductance mechanosensitive channel